VSRVIAYPLEVDGLLTRVLEAGTGDRVVILIHGLGARADRWRYTLEALATGGFHAYAPDLPGHGFAAKGRGFEYTVPSYTRFVATFADATSHSGVCLVGTSMGGHIAATMTTTRPDAVRKIALVGSLGLVPMGLDSRDRIASAIQKADPESVEAKFRGLVYDPSQITRDWVNEESRINTSPGAQESFHELAGYLRDSIDEDVVGKQLGLLSPTVPTLLVWGANDNYVPLDLGQRALAVLPGSRLAILSSCGHAPYLERPTAFNQVLTDFLDDRTPSLDDGLTYVSGTSD
jgi:pimeloyl-ACP methyl ester carboxylesterase